MQGNISTAIPGLDEVFPRGLPQNRTLLIEGAPGSGKSTFALQFLIEGVRAGEAGLLVTLAESQDEVVSFAASHGWSLDGISILESLRDEYLTRAGQSFFLPGEVEVPEIAQKVMAEVERLHPARVVIDSLRELRLFMPDALQFHRQIAGLRRFFTRSGVSAVMVQPSTPGERDTHLHTLVHGLIELDYVPREYGSDRRRLRVVKLREAPYVPGYHDYSIQTGGLLVFPRIIQERERAHKRAEPGISSSGIAEIDALLGGGIRRGTSALLLGTVGTGKSSMAAQYAIAAAGRNERSHIYLFDECVRTFVLRAKGLGMPIEDAIRNNLMEVEELDPATLSPGEFANRVRRSVEQRETQLVVVDSVSGYLNALPEERSLALQMHELLAYLDRENVTTLLVLAQTGQLCPAQRHPVDLSYLADAILLFRSFESQGAVRKYISVVKTRYGDHEETIREYRMDANGIRVGPPLREFKGVLTGIPSFTGDTAPGGPLLGPVRAK